MANCFEKFLGNYLRKEVIKGEGEHFFLPGIPFFLWPPVEACLAAELN